MWFEGTIHDIMNQKKLFPVILLSISIPLACFIKLETVPPLWWDEGWTLQIARNWVEDGFYGRYIDGGLQSAGLSAHFPIVASAALSFKMFGVGVWQGRLPSVIYMLLTLILLFYLTRNLYNKPIAVGVLLILFFTIPGVNNPVYRGREILGETTTIFWLVAGYTLLWKTLGKSSWFLLLTMITWGIAINSKAQVLPFWIASLITAMGFALIKHWWRASFLIFSAGIGSWIFSKWILNIQGWIMSGLIVPHQEPLQNYYSFTAIVVDWNVREQAFIIAASFGFLTLLGLSVAAWKQFCRLERDDLIAHDEIIRISFMGLVVSWLGWYLLFSNAWFRYFYPPLFFGSIYASCFLYEITNGFSWKATFENYKRKSLSWKTILLPLVAFWIIIFSFLTVSNLVSVFSNNEENYLDVAAYVDQNIDKGALIESYESDMFFLLSEHRFHYPSDQVHVDAETHTLYGNIEPFGYNPLIADPDYLVLGPYNEKHNLYDQVIIKNSFYLIAEFPRYQIYERIR